MMPGKSVWKINLWLLRVSHPKNCQQRKEDGAGTTQTQFSGEGRGRRYRGEWCREIEEKAKDVDGWLFRESCIKFVIWGFLQLYPGNHCVSETPPKGRRRKPRTTEPKTPVEPPKPAETKKSGKSTKSKEKQEKITDTFKVKRKVDRFNGVSEAELLTKTLPDILTFNLDIVIVRILSSFGFISSIGGLTWLNHILAKSILLKRTISENPFGGKWCHLQVVSYGCV